jgi:L-asparaginase II
MLSAAADDACSFPARGLRLDLLMAGFAGKASRSGFDKPWRKV